MKLPHPKPGDVPPTEDPREHAVHLSPQYLVMIRPVGSSCWTFECSRKTLPKAIATASKLANKKITFADGSVHLQSVAILQVFLPLPPCQRCELYLPLTEATVVPRPFEGT